MEHWGRCIPSSGLTVTTLLGETIQMCPIVNRLGLIICSRLNNIQYHNFFNFFYRNANLHQDHYLSWIEYALGSILKSIFFMNKLHLL